MYEPNNSKFLLEPTPRLAGNTVNSITQLGALLVCRYCAYVKAKTWKFEKQANNQADSRHNVGGQVCGPWNPYFLSPSKGGPNGTAIQKLSAGAAAESQHPDSIHQEGIIPKVAISSHCLLNDTTTRLVICATEC